MCIDSAIWLCISVPKGFLISQIYVTHSCMPHVIIVFLNQAHTWFLKIASVRTFVHVCVCVCVCTPPRLLTTSVVMWHDMDPIRLVNQLLQLLYGNCSCYPRWEWPWH